MLESHGSSESGGGGAAQSPVLLERYQRLEGGRLGLLTLRDASECHTELMCFPYSGGHPGAFSALAAALPQAWRLVGVDAPGHVRTRGTPLRDIRQMAELYVRTLGARRLSQACLFGQSLGGYVAYEIACQLQRAGYEPPRIVIAGTCPPNARAPGRRVSEYGDLELIEWLDVLGGLPPQLGERKHELIDLFKDCLRADLAAYEGYEPDHTALAAPALLLGGYDDPICSYRAFVRWREYVPQARIHFLAGGHFFVQSAPGAVADRVREFCFDSHSKLEVFP